MPSKNSESTKSNSLTKCPEWLPPGAIRAHLQGAESESCSFTLECGPHRFRLLQWRSSTMIRNPVSCHMLRPGQNCTETLVKQPIDKCLSAKAGRLVCWQHDATSHPLMGRASVYTLLNQASHLTSFPEKSEFLCFSMLAHTGHDKAYPLSDQVDTTNTVGYKGY